jgi:subtilase family serine protease
MGAKFLILLMEVDMIRTFPPPSAHLAVVLRIPWIRQIFTLVLLTSFGLVYARGYSISTNTQALPDHVPDWANPANALGLLPQDQWLNEITIVLARDPAFDKFLADQQDAASPYYHQWLTPTEVGDRFGTADDQIEALTEWLKSENLVVDWVAKGKSLIGIRGTAGDVGRAFQTDFEYYEVEGSRKFSATSAPMLPAQFAPIVKAIRGLSTVEDRPFAKAKGARSLSPAGTFFGDDHYLTPADFNTIYDVPSTLTGKGVTIGIVAGSRTDFTDFANFRKLTKSTFANPKEVVPTKFGGPDPGPACTSESQNCPFINGQVEATLDVFRAASVAPAAKVLLVVSDDLSADAEYLVDTEPVPAQVMNISFGACESLVTRSAVDFWDSLFSQAQAEGISVFVASGDAGASGCDAYFSTPPAHPRANSPNYICSSSHATCLGGTEFNDAEDPGKYWRSSNKSNLESALSYIPEGAWNEPLDFLDNIQAASSGGGVSKVIPTPSWQKGTGVPSARAGRYTPDLSFSASGHDGYFGCIAALGYDCSVDPDGDIEFADFYGTSAAAPSMAGITALLDQKLRAKQGNLNPALYSMAASTPSAFHDVTVSTSGVKKCSLHTPSMCNNSIPGPDSLSGGQAGFKVGTGYDEVTGLGSLNVNKFIGSFR